MLHVVAEARGCRVCAADLPGVPRPLLAASAHSRIVIIGQAPGRKADATGIPWNDPSGDRLRDWLGVTREEFYNPDCIALVPMGFCYPGKGASGDLAPRPECAPQWHPRILAALSNLRLRILVGRFPLERYLPGQFPGVTEAAKAFAALLPEQIALPHPSPRNGPWLRKHPWFEAEAVPALRAAVRRSL